MARTWSRGLGVATLILGGLTSRGARASDALPPSSSASPVIAPLRAAAAVVSAAVAAEPAERDEEAAERLGADLEVYAADARGRRIGVAVAGIVTGGAGVGSGLLLQLEWNQSFGAYVAVAGGLTAVSSAVGLLGRSPLEVLAARYRDERGLGAPVEALVADTERRWGRLAEERRSSRVVASITGLALGAAVTAAGTLITATDFFDMPRDQAREWGVSLLLLGCGTMGFSATSLLARDPSELGYEAYSRSSGHAIAVAPASPRFAVSPLPHGGGLATVGGAF